MGKQHLYSLIYDERADYDGKRIPLTFTPFSSRGENNLMKHQYLSAFTKDKFDQIYLPQIEETLKKFLSAEKITIKETEKMLFYLIFKLFWGTTPEIKDYKMFKNLVNVLNRDFKALINHRHSLSNYDQRTNYYLSKNKLSISGFWKDMDFSDGQITGEWIFICTMIPVIVYLIHKILEDIISEVTLLPANEEIFNWIHELLRFHCPIKETQSQCPYLQNQIYVHSNYELCHDEKHWNKPHKFRINRSKYQTTTDKLINDPYENTYDTVSGTVVPKDKKYCEALGYAPLGWGYRRCGGESLIFEFFHLFILELRNTQWKITGSKVLYVNRELYDAFKQY
jgi:hypothetical protein